MTIKQQLFYFFTAFIAGGAAFSFGWWLCWYIVFRPLLP